MISGNPDIRWYWTVPFNSGAWDSISSFNPYSGPETGSAAPGGGSRAHYAEIGELVDGGISSALAPNYCWAGQHFYLIDFDGDHDLYRCDALMSTDAERIADVSSVGGRSNRGLLVFPELDYYVAYLAVESGSSDNNLFRRTDLDGGNPTTIATLIYPEDEDDVLDPPTAVRDSMQYWCSDRVNGVIYSTELHVEYTLGIVTLIEQKVFKTLVSDGTRTELYSLQQFPEPLFPKRLYPPKWCYINEQVLLCEEEHTGAWVGLGDYTYDQTNILGIEADGTINTLLSYETPFVVVDDDPDFKAPISHPTAVWSSGLKNKMYQTRSPLGGVDREEAEVGLWQYDLDGTNGERLCNDPREQNFEYSESATPYTVLGPGTRGAWET